tara:strand:+ start:1107 stop:2948 length:1842 start_codon:yes stop_codon:yes gene_type:complete
MCGIAGFFGKRKIEKNIINRTLKLMRNRGPDTSKYFTKKINNEFNVCLLHSRLSIIDLNERSNQPFFEDGNVLVFNGEIYNYLELRKKLTNLGEKFKTNSDTEVLIKYYKLYGEKCVEFFEGMWAFVIYDSKKKKFFASRDRFGEKPFFYYKNNGVLYFGSEIKFIKSLVNKELEVNNLQLNNFLSSGYKSLYKSNKTYFKNIYFLKSSESLSISSEFEIKKNIYWKPQIKKFKDISLKECIEESKRLLFKSLRLRLRSDVPIAICLSGGVDSSGLASVLVKEFDFKTKTFSIIDTDDRYNESKNIDYTIKDLNCENIKISLNKNLFLDQLIDQIKYHDAPVATISYFVHSLLTKSISENGFKVAISGTAADEIYSGYYDHFLQHLKSCKDSNQDYELNLKYWKKYICKNIRNENLKKGDLYIKNSNFRDHIYDGRNDIKEFIIQKDYLEFEEEDYNDNLFTNRRLNELFHEITPLILNHEDLNSMRYSLENRSPYLDTDLINFMFSVPNNYLIRNGYGKYILRETFSGYLNEKVRLDRVKKGFNASINSLINFKDKNNLDFLLDKNSKIFEFVRRDKIKKLFTNNKTPNHLSKFLFAFISSKIFLDINDKTI